MVKIIHAEKEVGFRQAIVNLLVPVDMRVLVELEIFRVPSGFAFYPELYMAAGVLRIAGIDTLLGRFIVQAPGIPAEWIVGHASRRFAVVAGPRVLMGGTSEQQGG